jgi:hypothetical protein
MLTRACILAKSSRSPLKQLKDRVIPAPGIHSDGRSPSTVLKKEYGHDKDAPPRGGGSPQDRRRDSLTGKVRPSQNAIEKFEEF